MSEKRVKHPCPCCGFRTLGEQPPGTFELCLVCFWEDDPVQFDDPRMDGGANEMSLIEAGASFAELGAVSREFIQLVRPPTDDERE